MTPKAGFTRRRGLIGKAIGGVITAHLALSGAAFAQPSEPVGESASWFYMVKTKSTDPAQVDAFNAWYDDIDVPDVLEVPSFKRARRAVAEEVESLPPLDEREGDYVALYDITADDIDTAIIDLYVAARRMTARGRITDLLEVTEASYYQLMRSASGASSTDNQSTYFLIQKVLCCADAADRDRMLTWYADTLEPALIATPGVAELRVFDLYRVMEVEAMSERELPHLVIVHQLAASPEAVQAVVERVRGATAQLIEDAGIGNLAVEGDDTALYRQITDVRAP